MRVNEEHLVAMRAYLLRDQAEFHRLTDGYLRPDRWVIGALLSAALFVLSERRFSDRDTAAVEVADFVTRLRGKGAEIAELVDQQVAEHILLSWILDLDTTIDEDAKSIHHPILLAGLIGETDFDQAGLEEVLNESRELADSLLIEQPDPEPDEEDLGERVGRRHIAVARALLTDNIAEFYRLHPRPLNESEPALAVLMISALILMARRRFPASDTTATDIAEYAGNLGPLLPPLVGLDKIPWLAHLEPGVDPRSAEQILTACAAEEFRLPSVEDDTRFVFDCVQLLFAMIKEAQPSLTDLTELLLDAGVHANELLDS